MQTYESLKHTTWECKYHVVFIPKCRRKVLYQGIRQELGMVFRSLAEQWGCKVEEGHLMPDHVHTRLPKRCLNAALDGRLSSSSIRIPLIRPCLPSSPRNFSSISSSVNFWLRARTISRARQNISGSMMPSNTPSARTHFSGGLATCLLFSLQDVR